MVISVHPEPLIGQHLLRGCSDGLRDQAGRVTTSYVGLSFVMDRATLKQELEKVIAVGPGISRHIVMLSNLSNIMSETMTKIHDGEDETVDGEKAGLK